MHSREDAIQHAVEETFEWMLDADKPEEPESLSDASESEHSGSIPNADEYEESEKERREAQKKLRARTRELYVDWLREGHGIFHVSGKPGSGKSTLMRFLASHPKIRHQLDVWAGNKTLSVASFFFWESSGDPLQKSLQGLYRSILFETLSQCPDLIRDVFPTQWRLFSNEGGDSSVEAIWFRPPKIQEAFGLLMTKIRTSEYRLCIFIDGLDECEGDNLNHQELAKKLQTWSTYENVKICVSCRPYIAFTTAFSSATTIHLHELNEHDIRTFSRHMIKANTSSTEIGSSSIRLIDDIVSMAEGVFLWAFLVIRLMVTSISRGDPVETQKKKLQSVPRGLDDLYDRLLEKIDKTDRERSDQILLLAAMNPWDRQLNALDFSWLDDLPNPQFPSPEDFHPYSDQEIDIRHERVRRQLNDLTKGLLEVRTMDRSTGRMQISWPIDPKCFSLLVDFFHRTAREYLLSERRLNQLLSSFPGFYSTDPYGRLLLAEVGFLLSRPTGFSINNWYNYVAVSLHRHQPLQGLLPFSTLRSFKTVLETSRPWLFPRRDREPERDKILPNGTGSFIHYAVFLHLHDYVKQEIDLSPSLMLPTNGLSILITAIAGDNDSILKHVLEKGLSLYEDIEVVHTGQTIKYPLWHLAVALCLDKCLDAFWNHKTYLDLPRETLKILVRFGVRDDCSLHFYTHDLEDKPEFKGRLYRGPYVTSLRKFLQDPFEPEKDSAYLDSFWRKGSEEEKSREFHVQMLAKEVGLSGQFFSIPIIFLDNIRYSYIADANYRMW
jgi:hypothetical protein